MSDPESGEVTLVLDESETTSIASELARTYAAMVRYLRNGQGLTPGEADKKMRELMDGAGGDDGEVGDMGLFDHGGPLGAAHQERRESHGVFEPEDFMEPWFAHVAVDEQYFLAQLVKRDGEVDGGGGFTFGGPGAGDGDDARGMTGGG